MRRFRDPFVLFFQGMLIVLSLNLAFWVRFDFSIASLDWEVLWAALTIVVPVKLLVFFLGRLHRDSWRHAGLQDLARIGFVNIGASIFTFGTVSVWVGPSFPRSVFAIDFLFVS